MKKQTKDNSKSGYNLKLTIYLILFIFSLIICLFFASKTLEREQLSPINYSEKGIVDYKVYLNQNEFYSEDFLGMNNAYIASLINYIDIDYNYDFKIATKTTMNFDYKIVGKLIIENNVGTKKYLEKEYTILDTKNKKIIDNNALNIRENVKIDYDYYNRLANSFRSTYGVDTNSYLDLYLEVKESTDEKLNYEIKETNKVLLKIPLSQKAIEINLSADNQNINKRVIPTGKVIFNLKYLILESVLFVITCIFFVFFVKYIVAFMKNPSAYDKYVNKILKEYDRLIVETNTSLDFSKYNIINIAKFTELLDVRDNLKVPILYYNIAKHEEGMFYIKNDNDVYLLTIKNIDLEKKK